MGFFLWPGKGLLWYSPLVILGLLGLRGMHADQPRIARALVASLLLGTLVVSMISFWSDGTWGPRYLVALAWIPLLAIAWSATTAVRRRVLYGTAVVTVGVQLLAVIASPTHMLFMTDEWTGQEAFQHVAEVGYTTPYGRDPFRWIPELSPLLFQAKLFSRRSIRTRRLTRRSRGLCTRWGSTATRRTSGGWWDA